MGLRLILGRAGSGKSELCLREMAAELKARPDGSPLFYLVPEQATFQAEYALATSYGLQGMIRAQVLSFRRLAWKVLQETGEGKRLFIDDIGKSMVLRRILEKHRRKLWVFRSAGDQLGTLYNLVQLYNELKRACIDIATFKEYLGPFVAAEKKPITLLEGKVTDLLLLLEEVEKELSGRYMDAEDYLDFLVLKLPEASFIKEAEIWVDGFYGFTGQEYRVLGELFTLCRRVSVALCLEKDCLPGDVAEELDVFYPAALTCQKLQQLAALRGVPVEKIFLESNPPPRFKEKPELAYLESNFNMYPVKPFKGETGALRLLAAPNRRLEVESLAREIIELARDRGCRWRDIAVISGSLEYYRDLIATVFADYGIPFFLDQKRNVLHHPLVEFIRSSLEVINRNWRYEPLFRCIKTEFLFPLSDDENLSRCWRERADKLENYVLAFGLQGGAWRRDEPWDFLQRDTLEEEEKEQGAPSEEEQAYLQMINETRFNLSAPLLRFQEVFQKAKSVREKTAALFGLLTEARVPERLELWSRKAAENQEPEKAREHLQVYKGVLELLKQLVELMGEEEISAALFTNIVEAGLDALRLSLVPPSLDQVFVGDVERSRPPSPRFLFLLGANDGLLPPLPPEDVIFSEEEREKIRGCGLEITPGSRRRMLESQFLLYLALTRASQGLRVSYSLADEEGRSLSPSLLIHHLRELFPALREEEAEAEPEKEVKESAAQVSEEEKAAALLPYLSHPRRALSRLAVQLSRWRRGEEIHPLWWDVYNWYAGDEPWRRQARLLWKGIFYDNRERPLSAETSLKIYGKEFRAGITRLEKFRGCPFSHFLSYGLRLKERALYRLESPDIGRFFHAVLRNFTLALEAKNLKWEELERETCMEILSEEVERLLPRLKKEILLSSNRYRFLGEKLKETVGRAALILAEQARRSSFKPVGLELTFGEGGDLPGICFELENGCRIELTGRIDRVDLARGPDGRSYLRVVDYKSGRRDIKIPEVFYGLSLQMLVYLDVLLTGAPTWLKEKVLPAGLLYFRVYAPLIKADKILLSHEVEEEMLKLYKMKGLVLKEPEIAALMDHTLKKGYSPIIPVGLKADGDFYKNSAVITGKRLELLRRHVRRLIEETLWKIAGGEVQIRPYRLGKNKACSYCPYKAICQFDTSLEGNNFLLLKSESADHIWAYLENAPGVKGDEDER